MSLPAILHALAGDVKLQFVAVMVVVDLALGVAAAMKTHAFRLSYVATFLRDDVLFKVGPWVLLYGIGKESSASIGGLVNLSQAADGAWALVVAALLGSFASSLSDFGVAVPPAIGGRVTPGPPAS